ncbi:MAG: UDP-2,3-diacylglucosamine diphosphatase LpxI [Candidatus Omnitrophica bacterium]|nr:UDP-2,3-diacylglucosamine diphosphatase LpxI [Candidatus Omnitrophota bacterium]
MNARIAIIAGAGRFPFAVAQEAKRQGLAVIVMGIQGWVDRSLAAEADAYEEVAVGQLRQFIDRLKSHGVSQAIMAGKVTKEVLLDQRTSFDAEALGILRHARDLSVPALLGAIGTRLAGEGITLLDSSTFLKANLCPVGVLTARGPSAVEEEDVRIGLQAARGLAALDIGQTVIVKERVVVAVEALEGTDAAIRRAHALADHGLVVVKMASSTQDRRFDLPVVGPETLSTLTASGVSCLAVEAGTTLLLDRDRLIAAANAAGVCLVGVDPRSVDGQSAGGRAA